MSFTPRLQPGGKEILYNTGTVSTVSSGVIIRKLKGETVETVPG
jgi:hypothetical protein